MANWSLPGLTDLYANFLSYMKGRDDDAVRLNDSRVDSATSLPDYSKRWNASSQTFQNWLSAAWSNLILAVSGGGTGATTASGARTNLDVYSKAEADAKYAVPVTYLESNLSGDVTMTTPATFYDGPSVSLTSGTWFVIGQICFFKPATGTSFSIYAKLWDGTTMKASSTVTNTTPSSANTDIITTSMFAVFVLGATTTIKVSAQAGIASTVISASGGGAFGSRITALKIA